MSRAISSLARRAGLAAALAAGLLPADARAQIFEVRRRSSDPQFVGSLGIGLMQSGVVNDGTTASQWRVDDGAQYRGSLEYALKGGSSVGAVATHARVPVRVVGDPCLPNANEQLYCGTFDGEVSVQSLWGTFHGGGGGQGLHGVLDAGLGYTWYRDFEAEDDLHVGERPDDRDFSFYFGTGFGYGVTRRLAVNLVQDFVWVRHQGENLSPDVSKTTRQQTTRLTVRYGFGSRRAGI